MTSSVYPISVTAANGGGGVGVNTDLLVSDIEITSDMVKPGGGGLLRLYFSYGVTGGGLTHTEITITDNGSDKGLLNADNDAHVDNDGYYRFDLDVEEGDLINLESSIAITATNFIRAHLVQFGA